MPQITKLVPVDGRLGIVLDIPPDPLSESVAIFNEAELEQLKQRTRRDEREECAEMIEGVAWSSPTETGEWALREAAKVIAGMIRARKD